MQRTAGTGPDAKLRRVLEQEKRQERARTEIAAELVAGALNIPPESPAVTHFAGSLIGWLRDVKEDGVHHGRRYTAATHQLAVGLTGLLDEAAKARGRGDEVAEVNLRELR